MIAHVQDGKQWPLPILTVILCCGTSEMSSAWPHKHWQRHLAANGSALVPLQSTNDCTQLTYKPKFPFFWNVLRQICHQIDQSGPSVTPIGVKGDGMRFSSLMSPDFASIVMWTSANMALPWWATSWVLCVSACNRWSGTCVMDYAGISTNCRTPLVTFGGNLTARR